MKVQILMDNPNSWILPYAQKLQKQLTGKGINSSLIHEHKAVVEGDVLCLLSCEKLFKRLDLNQYNLVVHESALPKGKGWSPLTWQILEGQQQVPITLFEATEKVDAGVIYFQENMVFEGHELIDELREKQGNTTIELILKFVEAYPDIQGQEQSGASTFYARRGPTDSKLDVNQSLDSQFNLLRVCDNERYPAYFEKDGYKYFIKIEKEKISE